MNFKTVGHEFSLHGYARTRIGLYGRITSDVVVGS